LRAKCGGEYLDLGRGDRGGWNKLHNEELHNFYSSPNIIRMMKSRRESGGGIGISGDAKCVQTINVKTKATWDTPTES
jgi:hypothetical protein